MLGQKLCRCPRCARVVEKKTISGRGLALYVSAWAVTAPFMILAGFLGPGSVVLGPLAGIVGLAAIGPAHHEAFPAPVCSECGASLDTARPAQQGGALSVELAR
jgi:hypothetical protein